MVAFTKSLLVGDGFAENVALGPIQNLVQYERVKGFLKEIEETKQSVVLGGNGPAQSKKVGNGYFISPTIVDNPRDDSRIVVEEPFGEWTRF